MATTRNELVEDLKEAVERAVPENVELDADTLESAATAVNQVLEETNIEDADDEEDESSVDVSGR